MEDHQKRRLDRLPGDDRTRGFLTEADRKYLRGTSDLEPGSHGERRARERIRTRAYNAILDFTLLFEGLQERDREMIYTPDEEKRDPVEQGVFRNAVADMIGITYLGMDTDARGFPFCLELGVARAEDRRAAAGQPVNTSVEFAVTKEPAPGKIDIDQVLAKVREDRLDELTEHELQEYARLTMEVDEFDADAVRDARVEKYAKSIRDLDGKSDDE